MNLSVGNKTRVYILTGLPYAGKTTLRTELVKRFRFGVASVDEEIDKKEFKVEQMSQNDWNLVYSQAYDKLKKLLKEGKTVILDSGNLKRSERDTARRIAESKGASYKLIYVNTPKEVVSERRQRNLQTKDRGQLVDATMERALAMFEELTSDENPIFYNQEMNLDEWIKKNID